MDFKLVKVINHKCVIFGRYNSTTEFVRLRLQSKVTVGSALRGISWETLTILAASRLRSWMTTELNDNSSDINSFTIEVTSTQTTVTNKTTTSCQQRSIYVVRTLNRRWKLTECTVIVIITICLMNNWLLIDVIRFRKAASPVVFVS